MTEPKPDLPEPQFSCRSVRGVDSAHAEWGANCGPSALAAALGLDVPGVRQFVEGDAGFKGYMGANDFKRSLYLAGARLLAEQHKPEPRDLGVAVAALERDHPVIKPGAPVIVLIRWHGTWDRITDPRRRGRVQATNRHAVCYRHAYLGPIGEFGQREHGPGWVLDTNNEGMPNTAIWLPTMTWLDHVVPNLIPRRGTGKFSIDWLAAVDYSSN